MQSRTKGYREDSLFLLPESINRIGDEIQVRDARPTIKMSYTMDYKDGRFTFRFLGKTVILNFTDERVHKIRHEMVYSCLERSSDAKISTIGVVGEESLLTPDFIDHENKWVFDLATTDDDSIDALQRSYDDKVKKYRYLTEPRGYQFEPIIVSSTRVLTRFKLHYGTVSALCFRHRLASSFMPFIVEKTGYDVFHEDLTWAEDRVKRTMRSIKDLSVSESVFDKEQIESVSGPTTEKDKSLLERYLKSSLSRASDKSPASDNDIGAYLDKFNSTNSRVHSKRICNIPIVERIQSSKTTAMLTTLGWSGPRWLEIIWESAIETEVEVHSLETLIKESLGDENYEKHRVQKQAAFNVSLKGSDRTNAALTGLFAKSMKGFDEVILKRMEDNKSFHPTDNSTVDIETFLKRTWLSPGCGKATPDSVDQLIRSAKSLWNANPSTSEDLFNLLVKTRLACFGSLITELMTEIVYCYKYWSKRSDFYHKISKSGVHLVIRTTGSQIFCAFAFPKDIYVGSDPGRIGPSLHETPDWIYTDFCSYNEPTLEQFFKAGPYLTAISAHLMSSRSLDLNSDSLRDKQLNCNAAGILLLYLNNKTDAEELVTAQRYLTMGVLEDVDMNPYTFVSRLPEVIRSRLTCYLVKKSIKLMNHYSLNCPIKLPGEDMEISGLVPLFGDGEIEFSEKLNEFYFGYVVSKERGRGSDRNFKIMKKIVEEEYKARDTVKNTFEISDKPKTFITNPVVLRVFVNMFKEHLRDLYGSNYQQVVERTILLRLAKSSFSDLATLKVASRTYLERIVIPNFTSNPDKTIYQQMIDANPEEVKQRPRVLEALTDLVNEVIAYGNRSPEHIVDLLPYSMYRLRVKGYFDSDIFPKPQHGGDREIHVLEIMARVCQYHFETASRALASLSPSDALTHPSMKDGFVKQHYVKCEETYESFFTIGKSADATRWCQRNHSSKFAAISLSLMPIWMTGLVMTLMWLWTKKRITFPIQFAANFLSNQSTESNPTYKRMQNEFLSGTGIFKEIQNNKMWIVFGMFQGILHYASTLMHMILVVAMVVFQQDFLKKKGYDSIITSVQGSDDSAQLVSMEGPINEKKCKLIKLIMVWKEKMGEFMTVYCNRSKSSIGTINLVEFNSEWHLGKKSIKPTFRWVSSCLTSPVVERFIDRIRQNQNTLSGLLEGGGKLLECAVVQICQAWLHYLMIGLGGDLGQFCSNMMLQIQDPSLGFYPLDSDFSVGLTGSEFLIYSLSQLGSYKPVHVDEPDETMEITDEKFDFDMPQSLREVRLPFGRMSIWYGTVRRMGIPGIDEIVEKICMDPSLIYENHKGWDKGKYSVFLKMFQPGVKESISSHSPIVRMMASSAYILSRPCIIQKGSPLRRSLTECLFNRTLAYPKIRKSLASEMHPYWEEYSDMVKRLKQLENNHALTRQNLKARSKVRVTIFKKYVTEFPVVDMCKKAWNFGGRVPLSKTQFRLWWEDLKIKIPGLRDTLKLTCIAMDKTPIELLHYISSIETKTRSLTLMDTTAKGLSLPMIASRIFWPGMKVAIPKASASTPVEALRQDLLALSTCWTSHIDRVQEAEELLCSTYDLDNFEDYPRYRKLKIMRDWLLGLDKLKVMRSIEKSGVGSFGVFTVRQDGYGNSRSGPGEWLGSVLGIPCKIIMDGNECVMIIMKSLGHVRDTGMELSQLLNSFCLKPPSESMFSGGLALDSKGIFHNPKQGVVYEMIPVVLDEKISIISAEEFPDFDWGIRLGNGSIRLVADSSDGTQVTILSERFNYSDWTGAESNLKQEIHKLWSSGDPVRLSRLEGEIRSCVRPEWGDITKIIGSKPRKTVSGWNLNILIDNIQKAYNLTAGELKTWDEFEQTEELIDLRKKPEDDFEIDSLNMNLEEWEEAMNFENVGTSDFTWLEDEDYDALPSGELWEIDPNFEATMKLFEDFSEDKRSFIPPNARLFFSSINSLCFINTGKSVEEFMKSNGKTIGILGIIFSLATRSNRMESDAEMAASIQAASTAEMVDSDEFMGMDVDSLKSQADEIRQTIRESGSIMRASLSRTLNIVERAIFIKRKPVKLLTDITTRHLYLSLAESVDNVVGLESQVRSLSDDIKILIVKNFIERSLSKQLKAGSISQTEYDIMYESINNNSCTTAIIEACAQAFKCKIVVNGLFLSVSK